jgi:hypothetical protein
MVAVQTVPSNTSLTNSLDGFTAGTTAVRVKEKPTQDSTHPRASSLTNSLDGFLAGSSKANASPAIKKFKKEPKWQAARDDTNTTLSVREPKMKLPSFETGGFVFFLHVPKTGGSTIRLNLMQQTTQNTIQYHFASGAGLYKESLPTIWHYLSTTTKRKRPILFLEVHGRDAPHLLELQATLLKWKRVATKNQIPTFFFTILREPMPYAMSYFNFFHVQRPKKTSNKDFPQVAPTEANLLDVTLYNPQCQFLARGEYSLRQSVKQQPSLEECQHVQKALVETMDWVGTTEGMNVETLVLLKQMLKKDEKDFAPERVSSKTRNESLSLEQLTPSAISTLESLSTLDATLYDTMRQKFLFSMWEQEGV